MTDIQNSGAQESKPEAKPEVAAKDEGLIEVFKNGETLAVHPSAVADHEKNGWVVIPASK